MRNILNITNGDCAVKIMRKAGVPGDYLPWRDVLHEGPVPANLSLDDLSSVRAKYITDRGWGEPREVAESFRKRDSVLRSSTHYGKVILWFEHDLYDQLQILQILDWFGRTPLAECSLSIICEDQYLGRLSPDEMIALRRYEKPVTADHLDLSRRAWSAFRASSPEKWYSLLNLDTSALPFLEGAIVRSLEEYPACHNGLSRSANQALNLISRGTRQPGKIFASAQNLETRVFMGDTSFWAILNEFIDSRPPLVRREDERNQAIVMGDSQRLNITSTGRAVLAGQSSWLDISKLNRWIGGVHLRSGNSWCWCSNDRLIRKTA